MATLARPTLPWPQVGVSLELFRDPPREYGILPFWFLNGELDPEEMRFQLRELREKGMPGVILHGRYGLETPYIGDLYLERIRLAVGEAERLGLKTWIYDEMNWPSGTADKRVLRERPDLAQRYLECVSFTVHGPWFMCLTGEDSRYVDFERSTPVAAFAISEAGEVRDLTRNLSFGKVVPWEVPPGEWRLAYVVEKRADYYIDALDPEATAEFLRIGYEPYAAAVGEWMPEQMVGFYTDEPAMHYFETGRDNGVVPWTKDMLRRFEERNGYALRPRLADLFFDVSADSARVRFDFWTTLTEFYSDAYYRQIHEWCRERGVLFTGHVLYEEWLRAMIRVEGNIFSHYRHFDVVGVDHLYPIVGTRDNPAEHVAMKVGSSAAHQVGSERLLCESFGGIFMDATMQRMKWIADWEYVLGVNLLNPHGFHYTLEGARKRDWPPSMFYQYPWWRYYGEFSRYMARLSSMLTGGRHVAKLAVLWPMTSMFATYRPQERTEEQARIENGFNELTDTLLRLHHDYDYVDEAVLAGAELDGGVVRVGEEEHELVVLPPLTHVRLETVEALERFAAAGGRVLGLVQLAEHAFAGDAVVNVRERVERLVSAFVPTLDADELERAIAELIEPDLTLTNRELFCLHRVKDDRDVYFVVNPTWEEQTATMSIARRDAALWDPSTGEARELGGPSFELTLPPAGSAFVVTGDQADGAAPAPEAAGEVVLDGDWELEIADANALVLDEWLSTAEADGAAAGDYAAPDADTSSWLPMVPGAWSFQLPAEPDRPYPLAVWFRATVDVGELPEYAAVIVDGFTGSAWQLWVNGRRVESDPVRSSFDSQMREVDVTGLVAEGENVVAMRLTVTGPTDGLVDRLKIVGDFALDGRRVVAPRTTVAGAPWTEQGYPFYSGLGVYRATVARPDGARIVLEADAGDDVLEVVVNGEAVAVKLWPPYGVDVTDVLAPGDNALELRVANTLTNLLDGKPRPSGLRSAPRLVIYA
jgi:hypothetical protein